MLIASSGDAETNAVKAATDAWAKKTGNKVTVTVASDMPQQLAQGFASGNPADVVYMDAALFGNYAKQGSLYPYADQIEDNDDFYESLRQTFTYEGKQYCVPKDFSTLALQINTDSWTKAGLTDADVPKTWEELEAVSKKLTTKGQAGLGIGVGIDRLGAFVVQNGGWWLNDDASRGAANTPEVTEALEYVQRNVKAGNFQMSNQLDSGLGWRGLRHEEVRDDDRGQLDQGRRQERLPRPQVQDVRAARRARRARARSSSPSAGASRPTPRPRPRPSTSSSR